MVGQKMVLIRRIQFWTLIAICLIFALFPFYWMILTSLRPNAEIYNRVTSLIPRQITNVHYLELFTKTNFGYYFKNSIIVAFFATIIALMISFPAAFAITNLKMKGREFIARTILFSYLVPSSVLFIPMFSLVNFFGLGNKLSALIFTYLTFSVPFSTWLMIGYLKSVPHELMESAQIDGCSKIGAMIRIVLPLAAPGVATAGIFAFTLSWNEFLYALVFITSDVNRTVPVGIAGLIMGDVYQWGMIMASAVMASIPAVIFYTLAQRFVVQGMTAGGVKG